MNSVIGQQSCANSVIRRQQSLFDWIHHILQMSWAYVGILGALETGGGWTEDLVGESQDPKNKSVSGCEQWTLFSWHFRSQSPSPHSCGEVATLVLYSVALRRFQWPTQVFPYKFLRAFKNGTLSASSEFQSTFHPKLFGTHEGLFSILSEFHGEKQNKWTAPIRLPFPSKPPWLHNGNKRHADCDTSALQQHQHGVTIATHRPQRCLGGGRHGSKHRFSPGGDLQKEDTLVLPRC